MKERLNIFFTIDKKFIPHFTVALTSLLENNKDISFKVYVINDIKDLRKLNLVKQFILKRYGTEVEYLSLESEIFNKYNVSLHLSKAVYFRLLITEIIPKEVESGLFLDADLVVTGSIKELAQYKFEDEYLLAVDDIHPEENIQRMQELGFPAQKYFNAGVLLINLKAWREEKVAEQLIYLADKFMDRLKWWDQDILNMYFYNKWKYLDEKYNSIHIKERTPEMPIIIHYTGVTKPWEYVNGHPYKSVYWQYLKLTPFIRDYEFIINYVFKKGNFLHFLRRSKSKIKTRLFSTAKNSRT